jgi:hypothetical protein
MSGSPDPRREGGRILATARKDLAALEGMKDPVVFSEEIFGFHTEQAVEKGLKAWIALLGLVFPHSHDLGRLFQMLKDSGEEVGHFEWLTLFTPFGVQYRYEAYDDSTWEPIDRANTIQGVRALLIRVEQRCTTER